MPATAQSGFSQIRAVNTQRVEDALSLVAPKWTVWVVETLAQQHQPMQVWEVAERIPFISPQTIAQRLAQMHDDGLLIRGTGHRAPYQLSPLGTALAPVHEALADWSSNHLSAGPMARAERIEDAVHRLHLRHSTSVIKALAVPKRFVHLAEEIGMDTPNTRHRLVRLVEDGLVTRTGPRHGDPYTLTAAGRALGPVYAAVERWSDPAAATRPAAPAATATRTRRAAPPAPVDMRTTAALSRSPAAPNGLFSHAPAPQPRVPATVTAKSAPARGR
jgi:DNA-binding HxlR family transcriptional regulator